MVLDLLTVKFLSGYATRPIHLFGLLGLLCALAGIVLIAVPGFQRIVVGEPLTNRPIVLLGELGLLSDAPGPRPQQQTTRP